MFIKIQPMGYLYAEQTQDVSKIEEELQEEVDKQLNNLDLSGFESIFANLSESQISIFGESSFFDKLNKIISGEFSEGYDSIWSAIFGLIFEDILSFIPIVSMVIAIAVVFSLVSASRPKFKSKSIGDVIHFVCYGAIIILLTTTVMSLLTMTSNTIISIKNQMDIAFPILLTMLTAIGGVVSVGVYQPAVALLSGTILNVFTSILMPLFIFSFVFNLLSNLTTSVKFDKFSSFFSSIFKWLLGAVFTIFLGFVSIQGITAGSYDGISIKTAKYAIKNSIPMLGGYLSDGLNLILASSVLIKNAVGASGLLLLLATIVVPLVKLIVFMFALKLTSAILEPISDSRICNFISGVSKTLTMLIVIILGVAFMYVILAGLIMCSANYF